MNFAKILLVTLFFGLVLGGAMVSVETDKPVYLPSDNAMVYVSLSNGSSNVPASSTPVVSMGNSSLTLSWDANLLRYYSSYAVPVSPDAEYNITGYAIYSSVYYNLSAKLYTTIYNVFISVQPKQIASVAFNVTASAVDKNGGAYSITLTLNDINVTNSAGTVITPSIGASNTTPSTWYNSYQIATEGTYYVNVLGKARTSFTIVSNKLEAKVLNSNNETTTDFSPGNSVYFNATLTNSSGYTIVPNITVRVYEQSNVSNNYTTTLTKMSSYYYGNVTLDSTDPSGKYAVVATDTGGQSLTDTIYVRGFKLLAEPQLASDSKMTNIIYPAGASVQLKIRAQYSNGTSVSNFTCSSSYIGILDNVLYAEGGRKSSVAVTSVGTSGGDCILTFVSPSTAGMYRGSAYLSISGSGVSYSSFDITTRTYFTKAMPVDSLGNNRFAFQPNETAYIGLDFRSTSTGAQASLVNYTLRSDSVKLMTPTTTTATSASFNSTTNKISFRVPTTGGWYHVSAELYKSGAESVFVDSNFAVKMFDVSFQYKPKDVKGTTESVVYHLKINNAVTGSSATGALVKVYRILKDGQAYTSTGYSSSSVSVTADSTTGDGLATLTISPNTTWSTGDYAIEMEIDGSQVGLGRDQFMAPFMVQSFKLQAKSIYSDGTAKWMFQPSENITLLVEAYDSNDVPLNVSVSAQSLLFEGSPDQWLRPPMSLSFSSAQNFTGTAGSARLNIDPVADLPVGYYSIIVMGNATQTSRIGFQVSQYSVALASTASRMEYDTSENMVLNVTVTSPITSSVDASANGTAALFGIRSSDSDVIVATNTSLTATITSGRGQLTIPLPQFNSTLGPGDYSAIIQTTLNSTVYTNSIKKTQYHFMVKPMIIKFYSSQTGQELSGQIGTYGTSDTRSQMIMKVFRPSDESNPASVNATVYVDSIAGWDEYNHRKIVQAVNGSVNNLRNGVANISFDFPSGLQGGEYKPMLRVVQGGTTASLPEWLVPSFGIKPFDVVWDWDTHRGPEFSLGDNVTWRFTLRDKSGTSLNSSGITVEPLRISHKDSGTGNVYENTTVSGMLSSTSSTGGYLIVNTSLLDERVAGTSYGGYGLEVSVSHTENNRLTGTKRLFVFADVKTTAEKEGVDSYLDSRSVVPSDFATGSIVNLKIVNVMPGTTLNGTVVLAMSNIFTYTNTTNRFTNLGSGREFTMTINITDSSVAGGVFPLSWAVNYTSSDGARTFPLHRDSDEIMMDVLRVSVDPVRLDENTETPVTLTVQNTASNNVTGDLMIHIPQCMSLDKTSIPTGTRLDFFGAPTIVANRRVFPNNTQTNFTFNVTSMMSCPLVWDINYESGNYRAFTHGEKMITSGSHFMVTISPAIISSNTEQALALEMHPKGPSSGKESRYKVNTQMTGNTNVTSLTYGTFSLDNHLVYVALSFSDKICASNATIIQFSDCPAAGRGEQGRKVTVVLGGTSFDFFIGELRQEQNGGFVVLTLADSSNDYTSLSIVLSYNKSVVRITENTTGILNETAGTITWSGQYLTSGGDLRLPFKALANASGIQPVGLAIAYDYQSTHYTLTKATQLLVDVFSVSISPKFVTQNERTPVTYVFSNNGAYNMTASMLAIMIGATNVTYGACPQGLQCQQETHQSPGGTEVQLMVFDARLNVGSNITLTANVTHTQDNQFPMGYFMNYVVDTPGAQTYGDTSSFSPAYVGSPIRMESIQGPPVFADSQAQSVELNFNNQLWDPADEKSFQLDFDQFSNGSDAITVNPSGNLNTSERITGYRWGSKQFGSTMYYFLAANPDGWYQYIFVGNDTNFTASEQVSETRFYPLGSYNYSMEARYEGMGGSGIAAVSFDKKQSPDLFNVTVTLPSNFSYVGTLEPSAPIGYNWTRSGNALRFNNVAFSRMGQTKLFLNLTTPEAGVYPVVVNYIGVVDGSLLNKTTTKSLTIERVRTTFAFTYDANPMQLYIGNTTFNAILLREDRTMAAIAGKNVTFSIVNCSAANFVPGVNLTNAEGTAVSTLVAIGNASNCVARFIFSGDASYDGKTHNEPLQIFRIPTFFNTSYSVNPNLMFSGIAQMNVTLQKVTDNSTVANKNITFWTDCTGASFVANPVLTDSNGVAAGVLNATTTAVGCIARFAFAGDGTYVSVSQDQALHILEMPITSQSSGGNEWRMSGYGLNRAGASPSSINVSALTQLWSYPSGYPAYSDPIISDGRLFISGYNTTMGIQSTYLHAVNISTGQRLWSYNYSSLDSSTPAAVSGGVVYVVSYEGIIYTLDVTNGNQIWNYSVSSDASYPNPIVAGGIVYVGNDNGKIYAVNALTGQQVWNYTSTNQINPLSVANGVVYMLNLGGILYALNATNGTYLWNYTSSSPRGVVQKGAPVVVDNVVFYYANRCGGNRCNYTTFAVNVTTHDLLWRMDVLNVSGAIMLTTIAVDNGLVFTHDYNTVYTLNATNGQIIWNVSGYYWVFCFSVADGVLFFSDVPSVLAYNVTTGSLIRSFNVPTYSYPVVSGGRLYLADHENSILRVFG